MKTDGAVNPIKMAWAYALAAHERYNARLVLHTKVEEVIIRGGKAVGVKTDRGDIMANVGVVNCTNAWSPKIAPEITIIPVQNVTSISEQLPQVPVICWESTYKGDYGYGASQKNGSLVTGALPTNMPDDVDGHFDESVAYEEL